MERRYSCSRQRRVGKNGRMEFILEEPIEEPMQSKKDHEFQEHTLRQEQLAGSEELSGELQSEPGVSTGQNQQITLKPGKTFWSVQGDFIYRHHNEPRVQLYVPKEETFPIPLKSIDVARATTQIWMCCKKKNVKMIM